MEHAVSSIFALGSSTGLVSQDKPRFMSVDMTSMTTEELSGAESRALRVLEYY
jgi:hypothetical protein